MIKATLLGFKFLVHHTNFNSAGPSFTKLTVKPEEERLDPSDAIFVQSMN